MKIKVDQLLPIPEQPRLAINQDELESLAESIREHGLLNPIAAEGPQEDGSYFIIDGERRWRAHKLIGLTEIECNVRPALNGAGKLERLLLRIIGNLQRQDMNLIERATGYKRLYELGMNYREIGREVKMAHSMIPINIKLLELPLEVQQLYAERRLPFDPNLVCKFLQLDEQMAIRVARKAANAGMTAKRILWLIEQLSRNVQNNEKKSTNKKEFAKNNPVVRTMAEFGPRWNALHQVRLLDGIGLLLEQKIKDAAVETCKMCALYDDASQNVCRDCPAVELIRRLSTGERLSTGGLSTTGLSIPRASGQAVGQPSVVGLP